MPLKLIENSIKEKRRILQNGRSEAFLTGSSRIMKKIIVTGASGFIGESVLKELSKFDYEVSALYNKKKGSFCNSEKINWKKFNVKTSDDFEKLSKGYEVVIHLIGIIAEIPKRGITHQTIVTDGTKKIIRGAEKNQLKKIIYVSAAGTQQNAPSKYHQAKWEAEQSIQKSSLSWTIFRPSLIFPSETAIKKSDNNFVANIVNQFKLSPVIVLPGKGQALCQPLSVKDLAKAIVASIKDGSSQIVDAGGSTEKSYLQIF